MPEQPLVPAPAHPIRDFPTPNHVDTLWTERVSTTESGYRTYPRGTLYSTIVGARQDIIEAYPNLILLREVRDLQSVRNAYSSEWAFRYWATPFLAEDTHNSEVEYLGDAVANPSFARLYTMRRSVYETTPALTVLTSLTSLVGVKVTAGGTGYAATDTLTISGTGTGAEAKLVVDGSGTITHVVVTKEGSGYTAAPTIVINTPAGSGATLVGLIQVQTAVLTSQRKIELPEDSPFHNEFVRVARVYEVLPGPLIPFTRYDDNLGPVQGTRQAVVWASQAAVVNATTKTTYEAREGSSIVAWKLVETWSDGTGTTGNPVYPISDTDFYDRQRGAVQRRSQTVVRTGSEVGSLTVSSGIATLIRYEAFQNNPSLLTKITETWAVPGPSRPEDLWDNERGAVQSVTQLIERTGSEVGSSTQTGGTVTKITYRDFEAGQALVEKITETWAVPRSLSGQRWSKELQVAIPFTKTREASGTSTGDANTEIEPEGDGTDLAVTEDVAAIQAAMDDWVRQQPCYITARELDFPDVLESLASLFSKDSGEGASAENGSGASVNVDSSDVSVSRSMRQSAEGSAAIIPSMFPGITRVDGKRKGMDYFFYMPSAGLDEADVLTRLTTICGGTVESWPVFQAEQHTLILHGSSIQLRVEANLSRSQSDGGTISNQRNAGSGYSKRVGTTVRDLQLPPTIHGVITFDPEDAVTINSIAAIDDVGDGGIGDDAIDSDEDGTAEASITVYGDTPGSPSGELSATTPPALPTSGLALQDIHVEAVDYERSRVHARVFNFADL